MGNSYGITITQWDMDYIWYGVHMIWVICIYIYTYVYVYIYIYMYIYMYCDIMWDYLEKAWVRLIWMLDVSILVRILLSDIHCFFLINLAEHPESISVGPIKWIWHGLFSQDLLSLVEICRMSVDKICPCIYMDGPPNARRRFGHYPSHTAYIGTKKTMSIS